MSPLGILAVVSDMFPDHTYEMGTINANHKTKISCPAMLPSRGPVCFVVLMPRWFIRSPGVYCEPDCLSKGREGWGAFR